MRPKKDALKKLQLVRERTMQTDSIALPGSDLIKKINDILREKMTLPESP